MSNLLRDIVADKIDFTQSVQINWSTNNTISPNDIEYINQASELCVDFSQLIPDAGQEITSRNIRQIIQNLRGINYYLYMACKVIFSGTIYIEPTKNKIIRTPDNNFDYEIKTISRENLPRDIRNSIYGDNLTIYFLRMILNKNIPPIIYNNPDFIKTFGQTVFILTKFQAPFTLNIRDYSEIYVNIINLKTRDGYSVLDCKTGSTDYTCGRAVIYKNALPDTDVNPRIIIFNTVSDIDDNMDTLYILEKYHKKYLKYKKKYLQLKNM